jgi:hypothetical protein
MLPTQFIPEFFVAEYYGLRSTIFWGVLGSRLCKLLLTQQTQHFPTFEPMFLFAHSYLFKLFQAFIDLGK